MRQGGRPSVFTRQHHGRGALDASAALRAATFLGMLVVATAVSAPAALAQEAVSATPRTVAPGSQVTVNVTGFPPLTTIELGAGPPASDYEVIDHGRTDLMGSAQFQVRLDDAALVGEAIVFVVATEDFGISATSDPVDITLPLDVPVAHLEAVPGS